MSAAKKKRERADAKAWAELELNLYSLRLPDEVVFVEASCITHALSILAHLMPEAEDPDEVLLISSGPVLRDMRKDI